jgi:large subunit ribosomal protein L29
MKIADIKQLTDAELTSELEAKQRHLFDLRSQAVTEKLEDASQLKKTKKDIARIKTVMRERALAGAQG